MYTLVHTTLHRQTLSPRNHCVVTGSRRRYETAKSRFQRSLTYGNNPSSTPLISNRASHGTSSSLLEGCIVCISSTVLASYHVPVKPGWSKLWPTCRSKNYTCLTERRGMRVKCLAQPWFLSRSRLSMLPSGISDFHHVLRLPQAVGSISMGMGDNIVSVMICVLRSLTPQRLCLHASLKVTTCVSTCHWFLHVKSRDL